MNGDSTLEGSTFSLSGQLRVKIGRERKGGGVVNSKGAMGVGESGGVSVSGEWGGDMVRAHEACDSRAHI